MPQWPTTLAIVALPMAAGAGALRSHDVNATFVSADPKGNTFTVQLDDGSTSRSVAEGEAARALRRLKAGDKVRVTRKDTGDGTPGAATAIWVIG
jgi:translation initiation factor IF-1